ncbi:receptor-type tyrosine-protein phosphatase epsilon-like, partial [Scleropages formosus]
GYRQKDYFIATQGPLASTVEDFWRMVWEWKCHSVVVLTELQEREQEKCFQYWPAEGSMTYGDCTVEAKGDTLCDTFNLRDMLLKYEPEQETRLIRHFHFHGWPEIGIPTEGKGMIDLIAAVQKQQQQSGNHPIVVHCSAGAGRTGTFIALSNILERVKAEGLLDVFQTVKSLRMQRPHMVQTVVALKAAAAAAGNLGAVPVLTVLLEISMELTGKSVLHLVVLAHVAQIGFSQHWSYGWLPGGKRSAGDTEAKVK